MINQQCPFPRGKALGGTSATNALVYSRGNQEDYNTWNETGLSGWGYLDVLPYFLVSENSQLYATPYYHGKGGYLNTEYAIDQSRASYTFRYANRDLGYPISVDYNAHTQLGEGQAQKNTKFGMRASTESAFLRFAERRNNLFIYQNSYVTELLIHDNNMTCYGVRFIDGSLEYVAHATKEVSTRRLFCSA